jgi:hypothetical protein
MNSKKILEYSLQKNKIEIKFSFPNKKFNNSKKLSWKNLINRLDQVEDIIQEPEDQVHELEHSDNG